MCNALSLNQRQRVNQQTCVPSEAGGCGACKWTNCLWGRKNHPQRMFINQEDKQSLLHTLCSCPAWCQEWIRSVWRIPQCKNQHFLLWTSPDLSLANAGSCFGNYLISKIKENSFFISWRILHLANVDVQRKVLTLPGTHWCTNIFKFILFLDFCFWLKGGDLS